MPRLLQRLALAALAPALLLPLLPAAASSEPSPDCLLLRRASGSYSALAGHFSSLRKVAEQPGQHVQAKHELADQARAMGDVLRDLAGKLAGQDLKNLYWADAQSFDDYAETVLASIDSGDNASVQESYRHNVQAVNAANQAFHEQCR